MLTGKKRGRPPKPKGERAPTVNLTLRLRPKLLDELRHSAQENEISIAAEAEKRLSQPKVNDISRLIGMVIDGVEKRAGKSCIDDESIKRQCRTAADFALDVLLGSPIAEKSLRSAIDFQMMRLEQRINGKPGMLDKALGEPSVEDAKAMLHQLRDLSDARRTANDILGPALVAGETDAEIFASATQDEK